ncbi:hypothetical protein [Chthoniobacter flavus]|uniref:hypothetical protein n=1 Tax=Chthoniobacter flavus TaxID=191863 RepID=UPI0010473B21|nr:hypothetical protein [Chthoniobacter flavus]
MIDIVIVPRSEGPKINVQIDESATPMDLASAWQETECEILRRHLWDAIYFECVRRGLDPKPIIGDSPLKPPSQS